MKAWLIQKNMPFPKTHDFVLLYQLISRQWNGLDGVITDIQLLQPYAVTGRYPGFMASVDDAREALSICGRVRTIITEDLAKGKEAF